MADKPQPKYELGAEVFPVGEHPNGGYFAPNDEADIVTFRRYQRRDLCSNAGWRYCLNDEDWEWDESDLYPTAKSARAEANARSKRQQVKPYHPVS